MRVTPEAHVPAGQRGVMIRPRVPHARSARQRGVSGRSRRKGGCSTQAQPRSTAHRPLRCRRGRARAAASPRARPSRSSAATRPPGAAGVTAKRTRARTEETAVRQVTDGGTGTAVETCAFLYSTRRVQRG
eukprot:6205027-Pleurochrysis_carterae.AAC.3